MDVTLKDYAGIVGDSAIDELKFIGKKLKGKKLQHINSTREKGAVADMLNRAIPLFKEIGVEVCWDAIEGNKEFFNATKKFRNALQGKQEYITEEDMQAYIMVSEYNIKKVKLRGDVVFIHDPQPLALIVKKGSAKWIWRCHIDVSSSDENIWEFLLQFIERYDASAFSSPKFARALKIPQFLICPAIDPLSDKNKPLSQGEINKVLDKYGIDKNKPIVCQVSRYDYSKDPVGVIETFKLVKKYIDCQLVLAGNRTSDDPEENRVIAAVKERAKGVSDVHILLIPPEHNDIDINALQRASAVIVQKSIREGFGLAVTEALWKEKPVVASAVGGIPLQIKHKHSGLLCYSIEGAATQIRELLHSPEYAKRLAANGKAHIERNFLLTRLMREHMLVALALYNEGDVIYL